MKHTVRHTLEPTKAKDLLDRALGAYRENYEQYDLRTDWVDDETAEVGFKVSGTRIGGKIKVCDDCYDIDVKVPWLFRPFKRKITATVDREFQRWLEQESAADPQADNPQTADSRAADSAVEGA